MVGQPASRSRRRIALRQKNRRQDEGPNGELREKQMGDFVMRIRDQIKAATAIINIMDDGAYAQFKMSA
jgi:hypothetical protein